MSIATGIERIQTCRDTIRAKLVELGIAQDTDTLDKLADLVESLVNQGAVEKILTGEASSYTIPKGFHNGEGVVKIVPEAKTITPTKTAQTVAPAKGKVLSSVMVAAIPDSCVDTTDADASAMDILAEKTAYVGGEKITGTMPDNGELTETIDGLTTESVTIPAGYYSGGTVSLTDDIEKALAAI